MTRKDAILLQYDLFPPRREIATPPNVTLPEIVLSLRAAINGSSDPWPRSRMEQVVAMLRARFETWESNRRADYRETVIDASIFSMVYAAIQLAEAYLMKKGG